MHLRDATDDDRDLLLDLLLEAYNWTGEPRFTREWLVADPHTARYLGGWKRPDDVGLVAVDGPGPHDDTDRDSRDGTATPLGAIWARPLPADEPGYGYVADDIPELTMAVLPGARGRGVGTALLGGLVARLRDLGTRAVSLSVEDGNTTARALYERHGFVVVGRNGGSDTLLLEL